MELVTEAIRVQARYAVEAKQLLDSQKEHKENLIRALRQDIEYLQTRQQQITEESRKLYEKFALDGVISREDYAKQKAELLKQRESIYQAEAKVKAQVETLTTGKNRFIEKYQGHTELEKLAEDVATDLLNRVTVWPRKRVEISLNYLDEIPSVFAPNDTD